MVFVPMVAHRPTPPSPRAMDLARRLKEEVVKFERQYPGTSREDLRAAAALAIGEESVGVPRRRKVAAAVLAVTAALGGMGLAMEFAANGTGGPSTWPVAALVVTIACGGAIAVAVQRSRN